MVFITIRKRGKIKYYYVMQSERKGEKVEQKVIKFLGSEKALLKRLGIKVED